MAASYPTSVKSFSSKATNDVIEASHVNDLQDEVNAIESGLINGLAHVIHNSAQPRAGVYNSAVEALADATEVARTFDTEDFDVGAMHSTSSNTSRLTVPSGGGGLYAIVGQASFAANATGIREVYIKKNGATYLAGARVTPTAAGLVVVPISCLAVLVATDYVELICAQNSGGSLNTGSASRQFANALQIVKLW